jgi:hypothetical protein
VSKAEILEQLPKLRPEERSEVLDRLQELSEEDLLTGSPISTDEMAFLEREWQEYEKNPEAGTQWKELVKKIRDGIRG